MDIEEEIAQTLRDFLEPEGFEVTESDRIFAARVMPLVKRAQAEAWERGVDVAQESYEHDYFDPWKYVGSNPYIEKEVSDDE